MKPTRLTPDQIQSAVTAAIESAVSFVESEIAPTRIKCQRYVDGRVDLAAEEGRSQVIATKVRDAVRAVKPSLMRTFLQTDKPVEFIPTGPEDVAEAEQKTAFVNLKFWQNDGYRLLLAAFEDALVKKAGIIKASYEESEAVETERYTGLTDDMLTVLVEDDEVEVAQHAAEIALIDGMEITLHEVVIERRKLRGDFVLSPVPPEEFFVNSRARSLDDCTICGHSTEMTVSDLVAMGVPFETAAELDTEGQDPEDFERRQYDDETDGTVDASMKPVLVTEAYMRMDAEGRGVAQTWRLLCGGTAYKILKREECTEPPFAVFEIDPAAHSFFGRSLAEILIEDQDAATSLLRGLLDNVQMTNTPRVLVNDTLVNMDDAQNNEIGGFVRTKDMTAYQELTVPFAAGATLPALDYFDTVIEGKTGVTRASMGLNPDALQSTTAAGVQATIQGASGQVEVMARNLAETGMKQLFRLLLKLTKRHVDQEQMMRLDGQYVPVDPRTWNASLDMTVNVGLGSGRHEERAMVLREVLSHQMAIFQGYGPGNGLVDVPNIRNTLVDIAKLGGLANSDRYFMQYQPPPPQPEQPQQPDPNAMIAQAEIMKAQAAMASAEARMAEARAKVQVSAESKVLDDDLDRDRMAQDAFFRAAELEAKYGARLDMASLAAVQEMPR